MNAIIKKPYSFSISLVFLILGVFLVNAGEFIFSGLFFVLGSFSLFYSIIRLNLIIFQIFQVFIYIGIASFYMVIISALSFSLFIIAGLSILMLHLTFKYVRKIEYE